MIYIILRIVKERALIAKWLYCSTKLLIYFIGLVYMCPALGRRLIIDVAKQKNICKKCIAYDLNESSQVSNTKIPQQTIKGRSHLRYPKLSTILVLSRYK